MEDDNGIRRARAMNAIVLLDAALEVAGALALTFVPQFAAPLWARIITWASAAFMLAAALMSALAMHLPGWAEAARRMPGHRTSSGGGRPIVRLVFGVAGFAVLAFTPLFPQWRWAAVWMAVLAAKSAIAMIVFPAGNDGGDSDDEGGER